MTKTTETTTALSLKGITSGYGTTTIVRNIDLNIEAGSVTALLGPNGAGKSTLLKTMSGLIRPMSGSVMIDGHDVSSLAPNKRANLGLCHIPEGRGIFPSMTVKENLELQAKPGEQSIAIEKGIAAFPILGERLMQRAGTMSGGQQQMLSMARAYTQNPRVILVDEGSLGLAPIVVDEIFSFLAGVAAAGAALLIVDQFVARALALATSAYVMTRGEIVFAGTSAELQRSDVFERYLGTHE
ncbi:MAG: ABC transporter ATP-binding protein [Ilumatobacteraceae bacterium]|nr:ABC transporter ATP-binding protein [Ilumatobacteraceae bacterium]